jgi:hypothetical protein
MESKLVSLTLTEDEWLDIRVALSGASTKWVEKALEADDKATRNVRFRIAATYTDIGHKISDAVKGSDI